MSWSHVLCLGLCVAFLGACPKDTRESRPPGLKVLTRVDVVDRTRPSDQVPGVSEKAVAGWVVDKLKHSKQIRLVDQPGKDVYQLRVEMGVGPRDEEHVALVSVRGEVPGSLEQIALQASVVQTLRSKDALSVRRAVSTAMEDILYQARLVVGDASVLVKALKGHDVQRLAAAVEIAAVRREKSTVPALIQLLKHKDARVADRAIGALVAIGDRRAVRPLTRLSKFKDTEKMAKVIDGIGTLGGKEATEYLEFVASGHEDADIRNLAREALERMARAAPKRSKKR